MKKITTLTLLAALAGCASQPLGLNQQIALHVGETKRVGPDGFEITLRSVSDASGCISTTDCSIMVFDGTILAQLGEKSELTRVQASIRQGQAVSLDLGDYSYQLIGVRHDDNRLQALFIVRGQTATK